ncbi:hypothetical protein NQ314_005968 [Rhamnusium bicolor]|uniref:Uncharacterized protein n=1 Tax=Rhamnusium bicolor TaxID=1586634 RepID=A0AAV8ZCN5_9CUCU|nr:hypothetical protein NQ314_005968 [Rhamnusium bicolor]
MDHNQKHTGNDRKHWEYFEAIHSFLFKKPEVNPPAACSSSSGLKISTIKETTIENKQSSESELGNIESSFKKKKKKSVANHRNSAADRRHEERTTQQDKFLGLF